MRVALDAGPLLDPPTGVGRYVRELAGALDALGIEVERYAVAFGGARPPGVRRWRAPARLTQWSWRRLGVPTIERLVGRVDVVHATNFVLPALAQTPGVLTVHDLSYLQDDAFPTSERLRDLVPWSLDRAARVLVPSHAIAAELIDRYPTAEDRVDVIHEGVSPIFFGATPLSQTVLGKMGIPGPFVVAAGTIAPRKNLPRLLDAWRQARGPLRDWRLVLAGPKGWGPELDQTEGVMPIGWVGDETLPGLLAAADVFCYPSLYEGFGLPPLEAMAAGTATLAGRYSAAEEVLADAAMLVDPTDGDAIAEALVTLATDEDLRARLGRAGRAHAARYTWENTGAATLKSYRSVTTDR
ncbi:MAG: glycosyltransferase family 4 protein [Actinomycetota bacterium]